MHVYFDFWTFVHSIDDRSFETNKNGQNGITKSKVQFLKMTYTNITTKMVSDPPRILRNTFFPAKSVQLHCGRIRTRHFRYEI